MEFSTCKAVGVNKMPVETVRNGVNVGRGKGAGKRV